ncbi:Von Willebrand factor D and EGF domain-containing protein-like isoform X2 [Oopsacas minuta]|uniref:von Willebrand factor D and EGF domain-containing protein-like isoform X2 n=1 Tax=Oopsacas minuta TaxID=111878 RepID=A0AAV7KA35_9METZ|nr:Von Willebrand factor D and EGF domain-containing protein-like isoform X2 [Oopsacas minuta]
MGTGSVPGSNSYLRVCITDSSGQLVWSFICGEVPWTVDNGYVWCRSRGLKLYSELSLGSVGEVDNSPSIKLKDISCNRYENESILDCDYSTTTEPCQLLHGVACQFCSSDSDCNDPGTCRSEPGQCDCINACGERGFCDFGRCECKYPFYGAGCEKKECTSTCLNQGSCIDDGSCLCASGYHGDACQSKLCQPVCENGAECLDNGVCSCTDPFYGESCKHSMCQPPCLNGECLSNGTCHCQSLYHGDTCQFKLCVATCLNGGICNYTSGLCECVSMYYGNSCQLYNCTDCDVRIIPPQNNQTLIIISVTTAVCIITLLIVILIASLCVIAVVNTKQSKPPIDAKNLGLKNLKDPVKQPEEPLYEYLDGSNIDQLKSVVVTTPFGESYTSNVYEYIQYTSAGTYLEVPSGNTYNNIDTHHYAKPMAISSPGITSDRNTEAYVKMYSLSSGSSMK